MDMTLPLRMVPAAGILLLLCSCATSSREYVLEASGLSVTRGKLEKVEHLTSDKYLHLSDGLVLFVAKEPCQVTLKMGEKSQVFTLPPGSSVLIGKEGDFILQPQGSAEAGPEPKKPEPGK